MSRITTAIVSIATAVALISTTTNAFTPAIPSTVSSSSRNALHQQISVLKVAAIDRDVLFFVDDVAAQQKQQQRASATSPVPTNNSNNNSEKKPKKKPASGGAVHKQGILSPAVILTKAVVGDEQLNKLRAKGISLHSDIIRSFVDTADSKFGNVVLEQLFHLSDINGDGTICAQELQAAVHKLGFSWLQQKQIDGIFERSDTDQNGSIDLNEWMEAAPQTLRTNLIKLAKKNGGDLGLLV